MRRHFSAAVLAVSLVEMSVDVHAAEPPQPEEILSVWAKRASRLQVGWRHELDGEMNRFSRFPHTSSSPSAKAAQPNRLELDGSRFRYSGVRRVIGEHGYHPGDVTSITMTLSEFFPDRQLDAFERALGSRFAEHTEPDVSVQSFVRIFDGSQLFDYWEPDQDQYPRATLHQLLEPGSAAWPVLSIDRPAYELESLDTWAALMALRPGHKLWGMTADRCHVEPQPDLLAGTPCWAMTETSTTDKGASRTYWVDSDRAFVVRRFLGKSSDRQIQIDIDYQQADGADWIPKDWSIILKEKEQAPIQQFVRSKVTTVEPAQPLTEDDLKIDFPVGTWVVDEPAAEQFLVLSQGQRRLIQREECRWLPNYEELCATDSGQVGILIEEKIERRRFWRQAKWPLVIGIVAFAGAILFKVLQHRRNQRAATPADATRS